MFAIGGEGAKSPFPPAAAEFFFDLDRREEEEEFNDEVEGDRDKWFGVLSKSR